MPLQARTEFAAALNQLASEKGVDPEVILESIEQAILAAYRKDLTLRNEPIPDDFDSYTVNVDPSTSTIAIMKGKENITPPGFARIAAQTAKQVISQRLHEAEKTAIVDEYAQKVGTVISGSIQRQEGNTYFIDLGRAEGIMPPPEQTRGEYYAPNQRMKFLIKEIRESGRGPEVIVSRSDPNLIKGLFALEVPEIQGGSVEIKAIAREAGGRTKIAAISTQEGVDPVGSLVGQKGVRVQAVINELGEEKIDIIPYSDDPARFIAAALSPAKDVIVNLDEENQTATVKIVESQLSLAIGKGGQNVRLAAKLTGWKIDIEGSGEGTAEGEKQVSEDGGAPAAAADDSSQPQGVVEPGDTEGAVESVEENIDNATAQASADGSVQPEPSLDEAADAAPVAEANIAGEDQSVPGGEELGSMEERPDLQRGDLVGNEEPGDDETAPALDTETAHQVTEMAKEDLKEAAEEESVEQEEEKLDEVIGAEAEAETESGDKKNQE